MQKPNSNKYEAQSYRPISLLCTLSKIFEDITNQRLMWYLEINKLIAEEQNGFRKHRSTYYCHTAIETDICEAFACKQHMYGHQKGTTFDTTWRYRVIKQLQNWGLTRNVMYFINNFLNYRIFKVAINGLYSNQFILENGILQGSPISTTLFLVAINNMIQQIPKPTKMSLYADESYI